ncbi:hypothetical protein V1264_013686 [Littorina saxatilis]|uniref:3D domain-containing protein n=1 Tax=Littorina saxatilis TaxID=31220 RepID=A0AAN9BNQ6_9CAEN
MTTMMVHFVFPTVLVLLAVASGSDVPCQNAGGTCQDVSNSCSGHYQSGLCSGTTSRRCCLHSSGGSSSVDCHGFGRHSYSARGTAYYPDNSALEGGFVDMRDHKLHTLQDFLAGRAPYVSVAMDNHAGIAYGTAICIPQINRKYNKVVDTGGAFTGKGHSRIDICVQDLQHSYDSTINGGLTLVFP